MNNNSKQSDLVGLLWSPDSRGWIIIFLESFLHLNITFLNVCALHIWIQPTIHGANSCRRIYRMTCLHMRFLEDFSITTWKNALNQCTLVPGPEQGAFYQSLHSVTLLNVKNRVGCIDISVGWEVFKEGSEVSKRVHVSPTAGGSLFFSPGGTFCCHGAVSGVCTLPQVAHGLLLTTDTSLWCTWSTFCSDI